MAARPVARPLMPPIAAPASDHYASLAGHAIWASIRLRSGIRPVPSDPNNNPAPGM
jgi:hypothetical protein